MNLYFLFRQQTTVEEQSRIVQLEEELRLKRVEIEGLQAKVRGTEGTSSNGEVAPDQLEGQALQEEGHRETGETALTSCRQEVDSLKATLENKNQEISDLKHKVQQATKENMEMMDAWKAKFDTLVSDHQRSLEELKAVLNGDPAAPTSQEQDAQELRAALEALKLEHQLEMENLKAKHKIEAAVLTKEREDLSGRLHELREQRAENVQPRRAEVDGRSSKQALEESTEKLQRAERRLAEMERQQVELRERLELSEKNMTDYQALQKAQRESREEIQELEEKLRVTANQLQALQAGRYTSNDTANVIEDNEISDEKMKLKQNFEETMEKLLKREKEVSTLTCQVEALQSQLAAMEGKVCFSEKRAESLAKEKMCLEAELDAMTKKSHDASGQLVHISQELLKKERSLNELRVLLLESHRHSRDMEKDLNRDVRKAEWKVKEQKLQDDIKSLREKLLLLGRERSSPDHRRYSMLDPSALDSEVNRLRHRLFNTEDALRNALEHNQQVDQLVQAMRQRPDKSPAHAANSANGIHLQESNCPQEEKH